VPTTDLAFRGVRAGAAVLAASLTFAGAAVAADRSGGSEAGSDKAGSAAVKTAGTTVEALQRALGVPADGVYGPQTRRAVRRFQRAHDLTVDGIAGVATLTALGLTGKTAADAGALPSGKAARVLARIAACESGGNLRAVSADGRYRGKYQFSRATWRALGGTGDPADASEATQDRMALKLYRQRGAAPWPVCGG
jgi:peptidoglycan hydrolase-like protein with peptidoglycan-binding domain